MKWGGSNKGGFEEEEIRSRSDRNTFYEHIKSSKNKKSNLAGYIYYIFTYMYITIIANKERPLWKGMRGYEKLEKGYIGGTEGRNGKRKRCNYILIKIKEKNCKLGSLDPHPQREKPGVSAGYNLS